MKKINGNHGFGLKGEYCIIHLDAFGNIKSTEKGKNLIVKSGRNHILMNGLNGLTKDRFLLLSKTNYTPNDNDTMSIFASTVSELTEYDETVRQKWVGVVNGDIVSNINSKAEFTLNANVTAYGIALVTSNIKGGVDGDEISYYKFDTPKAGSIGDVFKVLYSVSTSSI